MSATRLSPLVCVSVVCALVSTLHGGWTDATVGSPLIEAFTAKSLGQPIQAWVVAEDPVTRRILVGTTTELLSYDGNRWRSHLMPPELKFIRSIHPAADGRIWIGAFDNLGYLTRESGGEFRYHSLTEKLPAHARPVETPWACREVNGDIYYIAHNKVLRWDGREFEVWLHPTSARLFPIQFENELWFHHQESGLYRIGATGPELVHRSGELPERGIFALERDSTGLIALSSRGFQRIGPLGPPLGTAELTRFLNQNLITSLVVIGGGYRAITTLQGIAIVSPERALVRVIDSQDGLPSPSVYSAVLSRDGMLWAVSPNGVTSFPVVPAVSRHDLRSNSRTSPVINDVAADATGAIWLTSDAGVYRLGETRAYAPRTPQFEPLNIPAGYYGGIAAYDGKLLVGRQNGADLFDGQRIVPAGSALSEAFFGFHASRRHPGRIYARHAAAIGLLEQKPPSGEWTYGRLQKLDTFPTSLSEDDQGTLWAALFTGGVRRNDAGTGLWNDVTPAEAGDEKNHAISQVVSRGELTYAFVGRRAYRFQAGGAGAELLAHRPDAPVRLIAKSSDDLRLYMVFDRPEHAEAAHGFGVLALDAGGAAISWTILRVPGLETIGTPAALTAVREQEGDTLWLGGSAGILRIRPDELSSWKIPEPPFIEIAAPGIERVTDRIPTFGFDGHHVALRVVSPEIAARPLLRFQTRFGGNGADWSEPNNRVQFDFSNLSEGTYTFSARAVNPADQTSEPATFTFRVLPPWYRSPWAYGTYAVGAVLCGYGFMLLRVRTIRRRNRDLENLVRQRTAALEKASAAKDEFLASMSHEIRNPLNGVVGLAAAIDLSRLDAEGRHRFGLLRHCATHLASLLEDILDFSRLESGAVEIEAQPFSPAELVNSVVAITSADSAACGLPVSSAIASAVPPQLVGDPRRIRQILLNFVGNALKYAGRGQVEITMWARPAEGRQVELTFAVSDEGPGIPAPEQARIFQKFERGAAARDSRIPGTGMGLAVCRTLAEKMSGKVWLESEPGHGATFYLSLQLPVVTTTSLPQPAPAAPAISTLPKSALVVDDEEYNCIALATLLERIGFEVCIERHPGAVLAQCAQRTFDLLFVDYDMPGINGIELTKMLREKFRQQGHQPIIIATTAYSTVEKRNACLAAGMNSFLGKPVSEVKLRAAVAAAVAGQPVPGALHLSLAAELPARNEEDDFANLRVLAQARQRTLAAEFHDFSQACAAELAGLIQAIDEERSRDAARAAHQLAGRFGFIHATDLAQLALTTEQRCQSYEWEQARALAAQITAAWRQRNDRLTTHSFAPAG